MYFSWCAWYEFSVLLPLDQEVGDVDMGFALFFCGVSLEDVADCDVYFCGGEFLLGGWDFPPVASHRYCGMSPEQMIAVFSDSTRAMGLSGCCGRRCSPKRHWVSCQDSSRAPDFFRRLWTQLILNLVNGVDRISEDKIFAAMLRKFVNTVYDIMRDVKFLVQIFLIRKIYLRLQSQGEFA